MKQERALTRFTRAFLDRKDRGRAAPLGYPVLRSEAALARVRATVAAADGSGGDAHARTCARPRRHRWAIAAQAFTATRETPFPARITLARGAHRAAAARIPHYSEVAGLWRKRAA